MALEIKPQQIAHVLTSTRKQNYVFVCEGVTAKRVSSHSPMEQAFIWIGAGLVQRAGQDKQHDGQLLPAQWSMLTSARTISKVIGKPEQA